MEREHLQKPIEYGQDVLHHRICGDTKDIPQVKIKILISNNKKLIILNFINLCYGVNKNMTNKTP